LRDCAPADWEREEVRRYRKRILEALETKFRVMNFFQTGSFQHGTAVSPYSDVDYMARLPFDEKPQSSTTILNNFRDVLKSELWETNDVHVDRPAVTLKFNGLVTYYEVTPAFLLRPGRDDDNTVFSIPAADGEWREAAPRAHNNFVADMDRKHYGNVKKTARLLKAWKYHNHVPISSFYLEMRAAEHGKNSDSVFPLLAVQSIASKLISDQLAAMNDPTHLVSRIAACYGETPRNTAMSKLRTMKQNIDTVIEIWARDDMSRRHEFNVALQAIWGSDFPYSDPE
jgi:hypothetical protein